MKYLVEQREFSGNNYMKDFQFKYYTDGHKQKPRENQKATVSMTTQIEKAMEGGVQQAPSSSTYSNNYNYNRKSYVPRTCRFWMKNGSCNNNKCTFNHPQDKQGLTKGREVVCFSWVD